MIEIKKIKTVKMIENPKHGTASISAFVDPNDLLRSGIVQSLLDSVRTCDVLQYIPTIDIVGYLEAEGYRVKLK